MISIIMPYWNRLGLLKRSLDRFAELYSDYDIEVVIVDDGSSEKCNIDTYPFLTKVIHLPGKTQALNPCVPLNIGVKASRGYITVLTNPEIYHPTPILGGMLDELVKVGPKGYILASAWSVEHNRWYCHSSITSKKNAALGRLPLPPDSGLHFCSMMYRKFYDEVGGFDDNYRRGQGVEDNDFVFKLWKAGAVFRMKDDLMVEHTSTPTVWPVGGIERNSKIFMEKWKDGIRNLSNSSR
jgi:glycosyltransferase involved in cell wall biosynthesis